LKERELLKAWFSFLYLHKIITGIFTQKPAGVNPHTKIFGVVTYPIITSEFNNVIIFWCGDKEKSG
jgi:hypothetical protein